MSASEPLTMHFEGTLLELEDWLLHVPTLEMVNLRVRLIPADEKPYTAQEVGDYQASEAELVVRPLRRRIEELESQVKLLAEAVAGHKDLELIRHRLLGGLRG